MGDYNSGLPVRTEADIDERLQSKIIDFTTPGQGASVDTDGNLHVEIHGNDPANTDVVIKLSEDGEVIIGGVYNASTNSEPATIGVVAQERNATANNTRQTEQVTAIRGTTASTVVSMDVALHDSDGEMIDGSNPLAIDIASITSTEGLDVNIFDSEGDAFSLSNPLPVTVTSASPGEGIVDFDTSASVAKNASDTHTYTVPANKILRLTRIQSSGSGKIKAEIKTGASGSTVSRFVGFNSTSNPNIWFNIDAEALEIAAAEIVEVIRTNRDNQSQDVYSTIVGELIDA